MEQVNPMPIVHPLTGVQNQMNALPVSSTPLPKIPGSGLHMPAMNAPQTQRNFIPGVWFSVQSFGWQGCHQRWPG